MKAEVKEPSQRELAWAKAVWDVMGDHGGRPWCGDCNEDDDCPGCIRRLLVDMGPVLSLAKTEREKARLRGEERVILKVRKLLDQHSLHGDVPCEELDDLLDKITGAGLDPR